MVKLFHIALAEDWERARSAGAYRVSTLGRSLDDVGFIHLSFAHQVKGTADAFYRGREDLVLLELDASLLLNAVALEWVPQQPHRFPHLYGPITPAEVIAVRPYLPGADGSFDPVA